MCLSMILPIAKPKKKNKNWFDKLEQKVFPLNQTKYKKKLKMNKVY